MSDQSTRDGPGQQNETTSSEPSVASTQRPDGTDDPTRSVNVPMGEFPFPLLDGEEESHYLTWIRDHSNYMATRGILDYLRAASVLVRGVAVNFLVFLPYLLLGGAVIAAYSLSVEWRTGIVHTGLSLALGGHLFVYLSGEARRGDRLLVWMRWLFIVAPLALLGWEVLESYRGYNDYRIGGTIQDLGRYFFAPFFVVLSGIWYLRRRRGGDSGSKRPPFFTALSVLVVFLGYRIEYFEFLGLGFQTTGDEFGLTKIAVALLVFWAALFALAPPFFKILTHRRVWQTGSDTTVETRDLYERSFGGLVLALGLCGMFEALAFFLPDFHVWSSGGLSWPVVAAVGGGILVVGVADKILFHEHGGGRRVGMLIVGVLGLLAPLLVMLFVADLLVFSDPDRWTNEGAFWMVSLGVTWLLLLAVLSLATRAFEAREVAVLLVSVVALAGILFEVQYEVDWIADTKVRNASELFQEARDQWFDATRVEFANDLAIVEEDSRFISLAAATQEQIQPHLEGAQADLAMVRQMAAGADSVALVPLALGLETLEDSASVQALLRVDLPAREALAAVLDVSRDQLEWQYGLLEGELSFSTSGIQTLVALARADGQEAYGDSPVTDDLRSAAARAVWWTQFFSLDTTALLGRAQRDLWALEESLSTSPQMVSVSPSIDTIAAFARALGPASSVGTADWTLGNFHQAFTSTVALQPEPYSAFFGTPEAGNFRVTVFEYKLAILGMFGVMLALLVFFTVDVNLTSIHGLYRDRLASAFLVGIDTGGSIAVEKDLDMPQLANHEEGSIAPYHIINVALNLQATEAAGVRDRKSDYFIFSKRFSGGRITGYCESDRLERHYPQMDLATAMAISAAAASPNMGRATHRGLVAIMTLLNIRLGYWVPNPGRLEKVENADREEGFTFRDVYLAELDEIKARWVNVFDARKQRRAAQRRMASSHRARPVGRERRVATEDRRSGVERRHGEATFSDEAGRSTRRRKKRVLVDPTIDEPTVRAGLVGLGFSGGGIRSATLNLGIAQALHRRGVFDHVDYMSTVSGGGYLGSSISALMRSRRSNGHQPPPREGRGERISYRRVFRWQVPTRALVAEALGSIHENGKWVNVSDGGHLENLGAIELLRRRCKFIVIGDAEADPQHHFGGLANLMRLARIDLGIEIDIDLDGLRLDPSGFSRSHWAMGRIWYPGELSEPGYLLYLKSSMTGDEDEIVHEYRNQSPHFPHESTADQSFTEGQFEAYRGLGQHIGDHILSYASTEAVGEQWQHREPTIGEEDGTMSFTAFDTWFTALDRLAATHRAKKGIRID